MNVTEPVPLSSIRQRLGCDDCLEDKREDYQNCSVLYCVIIVHNHMHTDISSSCRLTILELGFVWFCVFTGASLFGLALIIVCLVYFLFVVFWLSVPVQLIAWKDLSPKWPVMCRVGR